jgi:type II secretory pathway component PulM
VNETIRQLPRMVAAAFRRLSTREQRLVTVFAVLVVAAFVYMGMIEPIVAGRTRMEQKILTLADDIEAMRRMAARVAELRREIGSADAAAATPADFSLFSFVDKAASSTVTPGSVAAMNPSRRKVRDGEEENLVEVRLSAVPLPEIVGFLRNIEQAPEPVYVRRAELKRRYDDKTRFDATIVAAMIERR